jgi:hypothetical protein
VVGRVWPPLTKINNEGVDLAWIEPGNPDVEANLGKSNLQVLKLNC